MALTIEQAKKGGNNIATKEVRALLESYGFVLDPSKRISCTHPEYPDVQFNLDLQRTQADTRAVKTAAAKCEEVLNRRAENQKDAAVPELPKWVTLPAGHEATIADDKVTIRDTRHPEAYMRFALKDEAAANFYYSNLAAFQEGLGDYGQMLSDLEHHYGFTFLHQQDGTLTVSQPDYAINETFAPATLDALREKIKALESIAEQQCLEDYALYETLTRLPGVSVTRTEVENAVEVEVAHAHLKKPMKLRLDGALERVDAENHSRILAAMEAIQNPVQEIEEKAEVAPAAEEPIAAAPRAPEEKVEEHPMTAPLPAEKESPSHERPQPPQAKLITAVKFEVPSAPTYVAAPRADIPDAQTTALVLDTNIIVELGQAMRTGKRSWADLLPAIADMPGIDTIYIPAVVADWELRGKISTAEGHEVQIDKRFVDRRNQLLYKSGEAAEALVAMAGRSRLDVNGERHYVGGAHPKIVIYETELDREFMDGIRDIYNDRTIPFSSKRDAYNRLSKRLCPEGMGIDLGEYSMQRVGKEIAGKPVYLCTNDINYFKNCGDLANDFGMPVGKLTLPGLLRASFAVDEAGIKQRLEHNFGAEVPDLSTRAVKDAILASGQHNIDAYPSGYPEVTPGVSPGSHIGESLETILTRAALLARGKVAASPQIKETPASITMIQKESEPTMTQEISAPIPYEESFGYKVGFHRIVCGLSERQLAESVREMAEDRPNIDEDTVFRWQSNQEFPSEDIYSILENILVHENSAVVDKDAVKKQFRDAYEVTKKALENPNDFGAQDAYKAASFAFVNTLRQFRKSANLQDDAQLAQEVVKRTKSDIEESPEQIDALLMLKIAANAHRPSFGMVRAIVKTLNEYAPISEDNLASFYSAYEQAAPKKIWAEDIQAERSNESAVDLKKKITALFEKDGKQMSGTEVGKLTGVAQSEYSQLLGEKAAFPPKFGKRSLETIRNKMRAGLEKINPNAVEEFDKYFAALSADIISAKEGAGKAH